MNKRKANATLPLHLGWDEQEKPIIADLAKLPHLLVAGTSETGLECYLSGWIAGLIASDTAEKPRLIFFSGREEHFGAFQLIEPLAVPLMTDPLQAFYCLRWLAEEADRRQTCLDIPFRIVAVINQFWLLMAVDSRLFERLIGRIITAGKSTGVHMILSADRPSVRVISGLIKAYVPSRLSFALDYTNDSRTVLDVSGAENLAVGEMLFSPLGNTPLKKLTANLWDKQNVQCVADSCREVSPEYCLGFDEFALKAISKQSEDDPENRPEEFFDSEDDMLHCALEVIRHIKRPSLTLKDLMKRLRIGYPRAKRIMETLESRGVVAPQATPHRPREILLYLGSGDISSEPPESAKPFYDAGDKMFHKALTEIQKQKRVSTSMLQKQLKITYAHAADLMDELEEHGYVGPPTEFGPREILFDL